MVCLGNICRSPLAEGILQSKAREAGLDVIVDSAGTAAYHVGEPPDKRSREIARKYGIDLSGQRARQFTSSDLKEFDRIYAMDVSNYRDIMHHASAREGSAKVDLIMNAAYPGKNLPVPDPYYGGKDGFEHVFKMLEQSCERIIEEIRDELNNS